MEILKSMGYLNGSQYYKIDLNKSYNNNLKLVLKSTEDFLEVCLTPNPCILDKNLLEIISKDLGIYIKTTLTEIHLMEHGYYTYQLGIFNYSGCILEHLDYIYNLLDNIDFSELLKYFDSLLIDNYNYNYDYTSYMNLST